MMSSQVKAMIAERVVRYRQTMNDDSNEPALRYMASGAFEAMRELRDAIAQTEDAQ